MDVAGIMLGNMRFSTLVFVRHAHVADNDPAGARLCGWFDPPLSRRGWAQVERLCARLEGAPRVRSTARDSLRAPRRGAYHRGATTLSDPVARQSAADRRWLPVARRRELP